MKNGTEVTLNLSLNAVGDSNNGNNSNNENNPYRLLLTNTQVSKLRKPFANASLANTKLSKTQLSKMIQSGGIFWWIKCRYTTTNMFNRKKSIEKGIW